MEKYSYLKGVNAEYIDHLYESYLADPESVDESWRLFFEGVELGFDEAAEPPSASAAAPSPAPSPAQVQGSSGAAVPSIPQEGLPTSVPTGVGEQNLESGIAESKVGLLIQSYRELGRLLAKLSPIDDPRPDHELLRLERFNLSEADLDRKFTAGMLLGIGEATLRNIIARLRQIYCGHIGYEFTHIEDPESRTWLRDLIERSPARGAYARETRLRILQKLSESEAFENFLHTRYVGQKRFSGEGADTVISLIDCLIEKGGETGVKEIVMGMAHRGRLTVLANIFGKPPASIFAEFEGRMETGKDAGEGDVKYHMGFSSNTRTRSGADVHLSLASNPSHLEAIDPVVEGIARAKQEMLDDTDRSKVVPILIHGDASFAGQGLVYETLQLSNVEGYATGGTLHIVINNQVGFTTSPQEARSTTYATDLAMMLEIPIIHVNGDDPEAVQFVGELAMEYRQKFHRDVVIDLICYRRHGHNEGDEPSFTQPLMYKKIKGHPSPRKLYADYLVGEGVITAEDAQAMMDRLMAYLGEQQQQARENPPPPAISVFEGKWRGLHKPTPDELFRPPATAVDEKTLKSLMEQLTTVPDNFTVHPKLRKLLDQRREMVESGKGIDWGTGETLAYATLVAESTPVRLSGQDVERGTFSHRHAVLNDFETGAKYTPLQHIKGAKGRFFVHNSPLSEAGVLGFEFGYALADPYALTIWEAQFGDFANGAQVIIDQFIAAAESKWQRMSGLVLLLPHGYEGQGPEHSSARLERFLTLCGRYNMQVCNFTTPAQIFHALRRQMKRTFRKPLIVMSPKSLLRHPLAVSSLDDFSQGRFHEVLADEKVRGEQASRVLICSGKVYYELLQERDRRKADDVAILRLEQFYPWPEQILYDTLREYADAETVWVQEEPKNMGGWFFVRNRWLDGTLGERRLHYVGRSTAAAPAVGSAKAHAQEQRSLIEQAFSELRTRI